MDFASSADLFTLWLTQYGGIALFGLLALGIIALPVPEETLMVLTGILMHKGILPVFPTVSGAFLGVLSGISVSYLLGRTAGHFLIKKYGRWVGLSEKKCDKARIWFEKFGKWTLFFGYFIPGVRHLTGVSAGASGLSYHHFASYAYPGAALWVSLFLSIGYFLEKQWITLYEKIEIKVDIIMIVCLIAALIIFLFHLYKKSKKR
jgi:membrane protein DedA with SNARE-associated domain